MIINTLSTDKKNTLRIQLTLRGHYKQSIKSERELKNVLQKAIDLTNNESLKQSLQTKYNNNELLDIMRFYGMIAKTKLLETK